MNYKYNKDELKEELTIEQIYELLQELGADPILKDNHIVCKTICHNHNLEEASHKLYYYDNSHLFHCYTECGDANFDIYELILKVHKNAGIDFSLPKAINYVAKYYGFDSNSFDFEEDDIIQNSKDWQLINNYKKNQKQKRKKIIELKTYDEKILKYLPQPRIIPWENEGITYEIIKLKNIHYNPIDEGIVIPHYNIDNQLIGIRQRTLLKEEEKNGKYRPIILNGIMYNHPLGFALYNLNWSKENIKKMQKVIIFESEKSCLKYASYFGIQNDISVAVCGSNLIDYQVKLLISLGVREIIIAFDRQYQIIGDNEYKKWIKKLKIISQKYKNFCNISFMFDTQNLLNYKDSPIDDGKEIFLQLFKTRLNSEGK